MKTKNTKKSNVVECPNDANVVNPNPRAFFSLNGHIFFNFPFYVGQV